MSRAPKLARTLLAGTALFALSVASPALNTFISPISPAAAQLAPAVDIEFRLALEPYGSWRRVARWGEVWIPARASCDWRPYTVGHWVYSDDYGWYWISADEEAEWGWVTYHYGRWAYDPSLCWVWVPGNVWGPAWVDWRRGDEYVGWAPLPPDEVVFEYRSDPRFWMFVRLAELALPRPHYAFLPLQQRPLLLQRTVVVNRTVVLNDRRFAVNPGITPAIVAAAAHQPIRAFTVRPSVIAGTANIQGAAEIRADDLRRNGNRPGRAAATANVAQQSAATIAPAQNIPPPQALERNEHGRLGEHPPRAASGAPAPAQERGTTGVAPPSAATPPSAAAPAPRRDGIPGREERDGTPGRGPAGQTGVAPQLQPRDEGHRPQDDMRGHLPGPMPGQGPAQAPAQRAQPHLERPAAPPPPPAAQVPHAPAPQPPAAQIPHPAAPPPPAAQAPHPVAPPPAAQAPRPAAPPPAAQAPRPAPPATTGSGGQQRREER